MADNQKTEFMFAANPAGRPALLLRGDYGEYCIDLLGRAIRSGFVVREVPYRCVPRNTGESKTGANLWDYLAKGRKYVSAIERIASEPGA
jgi:dolichol-phosphate mannosyltransferase